MFYNAAWPYRVKVTVLASKVDADLTAFPVYVDLNDLPAGFHTNVNQTDARDIRVTTSDGATEVPRQVVSYTEASDTGELWFKGDVDGDTDTDFYIYYGNAAATEPAADSTYGSQNVWDANFKGRWHMGDGTTSTVPDSTANANTGNKKGAAEPAVSTSGKIGAAQDFDGTNDYVDVTDIAATSYTMMGWIQRDAANAASGVQTFLSGHDIVGKFIRIDCSNVRNLGGYFFDGAASYNIGVTAINDDTWYHVAMVRDAATPTNRFYLNGVLKQSAAGNGNLNAANDNGFMGAMNSTGYFVNGLLDEISFSNTNRATEWINAEYNNQSDPGAFFTIGAEESTGATTAVKDAVGGLGIVPFAR